MSTFAILLHQDNAFEIAAYEDISVASVRSAIAAATFVNDEPRYIVFHEGADGSDPWSFATRAELDEKYRYTQDKIDTEVVRLVRK